MPELTAAVWSAVAATFSAIAAMTTVFIHRRNQLDASRPELVLSGFARKPGGDGSESLCIQSIRNVGKGPALNLHINASRDIGDRPLTSMGTIRLPILAPGESVDLNAEIHLWWKNAMPTLPRPFINAPFEIWSWDTIGVRHITSYYFFLVDPASARSYVGDEVPGLLGIDRITQSRSVWLLKFLRRPRWWTRMSERWQAARRARRAAKALTAAKSEQMQSQP